MNGNRVTRFGEFSPIGQIVYIGQFLENDRSSPNFHLLVFTGKAFPVLILAENG
jgi:hypothetical protein